jgi:hypothetical protein
MSTIQSTPGEVTRAQFARLRQMDLSYVCRLAKKGRLVLTPDGKRVRVAESIALLGQTEDPSKDGVRERFAEHRAAAAGELVLDGTDLNASGGGGEDGAGVSPARGSMTDARRELIEEQAASAGCSARRARGPPGRCGGSPQGDCSRRRASRGTRSSAGRRDLFAAGRGNESGEGARDALTGVAPRVRRARRRRDRRDEAVGARRRRDRRPGVVGRAGGSIRRAR